MWFCLALAGISQLPPTQPDCSVETLCWISGGKNVYQYFVVYCLQLFWQASRQDWIHYQQAYPNLSISVGLIKCSPCGCHLTVPLLSITHWRCTKIRSLHWTFPRQIVFIPTKKEYLNFFFCYELIYDAGNADGDSWFCTYKGLKSDVCPVTKPLRRTLNVSCILNGNCNAVPFYYLCAPWRNNYVGEEVRLHWFFLTVHRLAVMVSFTLLYLYRRGKRLPLPTEQEACWVPEPFSTPRSKEKHPPPVGNRTTICRLSSPWPDHYGKCNNSVSTTNEATAVFFPPKLR